MSEGAWWVHLRGDPSAFLLDEAEPGVLWRTLVELLDRPDDSPAVRRAREACRERGLAAEILARQNPLGFWGSPAGYGARWGGTAWELLAATWLGADPEDRRMVLAAEVLLSALQPTSGGFATGKGRLPSACFTAEVCAALARLGFAHHPRLREAVAWLAARPGYPGWSCPELRHLVGGGCPVAAVAVLRAVGEHPPNERGALAELLQRALAWLEGHAFFLAGVAPRGWLRWAHPNLGRTDLLDAVYALARLGVPPGEWCVRATELVRARQEAGGRWVQGDRVFRGEPFGAPSRWVTLKALVVLAQYGRVLGEG